MGKNVRLKYILKLINSIHVIFPKQTDWCNVLMVASKASCIILKLMLKLAFIKLVRLVKKKKKDDYSGTSMFGSQWTKASLVHQLLLHHVLINKRSHLYWKGRSFGFRWRWQHCLCRSFLSVTLIDRRLWPQGVLARPQSRWHQYQPHNLAVSSEDAIRSSLSPSQLTVCLPIDRSSLGTVCYRLRAFRHCWCSCY